MNNDYDRGEWEPTKTPVRYRYSIRFRCGICGEFEVHSGEVDVKDEGLAPHIAGDWRMLGRLVSGHEDPLNREMVVCSEGCAQVFAFEEIDRLYGRRA